MKMEMKITKEVTKDCLEKKQRAKNLSIKLYSIFHFFHSFTPRYTKSRLSIW